MQAQQLSSLWRGAVLLAVGLVAGTLALFALAACGDDDSGGAAAGEAAAGDAAAGAEDVAGARKIEPDRVLTLDDFKAVGFKKDKSYDVSELPGAEAAYYGFWGLDPSSRDDFEFRIYASQAEAIELGTERAIQRIGEDALLTKDTAIWKVGIKDARTCRKRKGGADSSGTTPDCTTPKYYDYVFVGNVILFCPGLALDDARKNCNELLAQLQ